MAALARATVHDPSATITAAAAPTRRSPPSPPLPCLLRSPVPPIDAPAPTPLAPLPPSPAWPRLVPRLRHNSAAACCATARAFAPLPAAHRPVRPCPVPHAGHAPSPRRSGALLSPSAPPWRRSPHAAPPTSCCWPFHTHPAAIFLQPNSDLAQVAAAGGVRTQCLGRLLSAVQPTTHHDHDLTSSAPLSISSATNYCKYAANTVRSTTPLLLCRSSPPPIITPPPPPRHLLRPPPPSPPKLAAASTLSATHCSSPVAAPPDATHFSPPTGSKATPFRRHEEMGWRSGRRIGARKRQKIVRQDTFSCMFLTLCTHKDVGPLRFLQCVVILYSSSQHR
nr:vegetative cell wall protein gp1-like [Aegilops tauschii subsp. strangulata]